MPLALLSLLFLGAIFGFFYAWVCSTMWGLDSLPPEIAIRSMQAMNAAVRNVVFFPAFFLTPLVLAVTGAALWRRSRPAARAFLAAAAVYGLGGLLPTLLINVPMNEALAAADPTRDAAATWGAYSPRWQVWNAARTVASGAALLLAGWGTWRLGRAG